MKSPPTHLFGDVKEIESLLHDFESGTLERADWNHRAHLTVALGYFVQHGPDIGSERLRSGIQEFNRRHGIEVTPTGGYHETLTCFWIRVVQSHMDAAPAGESLLALANGLAPLWGQKDLPLEHYTRERLFSPEARTEWVEPDLRAI